MKELTPENIKPETPLDFVLDFLRRQFFTNTHESDWNRIFCHTVSAVSRYPSVALLKPASTAPLVSHYHLPVELITRIELLHATDPAQIPDLLKSEFRYPSVQLIEIYKANGLFVLLLNQFQQMEQFNLPQNFKSETGQLCSLYEKVSYKKYSDEALQIHQQLVAIDTEQYTTVEPLLNSCLELLLQLPWFKDKTAAGGFIFDDKTGKMRLLTAIGSNILHAEYCQMSQKGECLCGISWQSGEPVISSSHAQQHLFESQREHKDCCFPLVYSNRILGIIVFHLPPGSWLTPIQLQITRSLIRTAALQIHQQFQKQSLMEANRTLENRVAERTEGLQKEAANRREAEEKLREINRSLDERIQDRTVELVEAIKRMTLEVDQRKQAEEALAHSERIYRTLVETSPNAVFLLDNTLHILKTNTRAMELLQLDDSDQMLHMEFKTLLVSGETEITDLVERLGSSDTIIMESDVCRPNDTVFPAEISFAAEPDESGVPFFIIAVISDITERREHEKKSQELQQKLIDFNQQLDMKVKERTAELRDAMDKANLAVRTRNAFLSSMSHELRTPLNSIIGFSEVLLEGTEGELNETQKNDLREVWESGQHLLKLLNQILEMSRFEGEKNRNEITPCDIGDVVDTAVSMIRGQAFKKGVTLEWEKGFPEDLPMISTDAGKLRHILFQLLSNAVKFTPRNGTVELQIKLHETEKQLCFTVTDNGCGIDPADQEHIFEKFYQVHTDHTDKPDGTGLGLAFARRLARQLSGELQVHSDGRGTGSCFMLTVPVEL